MNHDGTSGTVDLFSKYVLTGYSNFSDNGDIYNGSNLDSYLESILYKYFSAEVKNALNLMNVQSDGIIIQRHVVAPSITEVGLTYYSNPEYIIQEGYIYPIFAPVCELNPKAIFTNPGSTIAKRYWTRTPVNYNYPNEYYRYIWQVDSDGSRMWRGCFDQSAYIEGRIRFAKA